MLEDTLLLDVFLFYEAAKKNKVGALSVRMYIEIEAVSQSVRSYFFPCPPLFFPSLFSYLYPMTLTSKNI